MTLPPRAQRLRLKSCRRSALPCSVRAFTPYGDSGRRFREPNHLAGIAQRAQRGNFGGPSRHLADEEGVNPK